MIKGAHESDFNMEQYPFGFKTVLLNILNYLKRRQY